MALDPDETQRTAECRRSVSNDVVQSEAEEWTLRCRARFPQSQTAASARLGSSVRESVLPDWRLADEEGWSVLSCFLQSQHNLQHSSLKNTTCVKSLLHMSHPCHSHYSKVVWSCTGYPLRRVTSLPHSKPRRDANSRHCGSIGLVYAQP